MSKILITGTAGFIGFHLALKLIEMGEDVYGLDNINDYYDTRIKFGRLKETGIIKSEIEYNKLIKSCKHENYHFIKLNLEDYDNISLLFKNQKFDFVCNLAAQAGVRYSLTNPSAYINSNITGFLHILEACRHNHVKHLIYASSSSVYGLNEIQPFSASHNVDHPISLYAASKKSNELMAHSYSYLFSLPTTGLRFFTVYGPWGRPDMALFIFTRAICENRPIDVYNFGNMSRDFTYIDDIVNSLSRIIFSPAAPDPDWSGKDPVPSSSRAPYRLYNIGNNNPVKLMDFIHSIEDNLGKKATINLLPLQPGDVPSTYADVSGLIKDFNYKPNTPVNQGIADFIKWYKRFYDIPT